MKFLLLSFLFASTTGLISSTASAQSLTGKQAIAKFAPLANKLSDVLWDDLEGVHGQTGKGTTCQLSPLITGNADGKPLVVSFLLEEFKNGDIVSHSEFLVSGSKKGSIPETIVDYTVARCKGCFAASTNYEVKNQFPRLGVQAATMTYGISGNNLTVKISNDKPTQTEINCTFMDVAGKLR